ncbi:MAG: acetoacetyl-CoA synthetase, partial [Thermoleophilaceae bacterium]|nr:acetoacetyl-CoA synthetase [Thermoleophilaceae bacterium]
MGALAPAQSAGDFRPDASTVSGSQLSAFIRSCEAETGRRFADSQSFHSFSVRDYRRFWAHFLSWSDLLWEGSPEPVCTDDLCERATFFPEVRLNYAENLLRVDGPAGAEAIALVAHHASAPPARISRGELRSRVRGVAAGLARLGLRAGDSVAAVAGNNAEVVVGGLATAALGATFSSAGPDMGTPALLTRFEQLAPKVLFANLVGGGEAASTTLADRVAELTRRLPSLTALVALDDGPAPRDLTVPVHRLADMATAPADGEWARFPFNQPLFVLFTSGTTGPPKCIVHGAGGTLLEHVKEHRLHVDLRPEDRLLFHTSAAWMMWNWQLSALASGSAIVLYDGPLTGPETLWRLVSEEEVSVFGTSPPYLRLSEDSGFSPRREMAFPNLRSILSTGSILHDWQYDWVREHVGPLPVQSVSGGTDILGCFVLGNPNLPVRRGWIQCRSLGMDVQALPSATTPPGSRIGELVCRNPFPSRPLGFLGGDERLFHEAYFEQNPGVWTHGDLIELDDLGQARIHGRSDGVVQVQGVRIGPAEIYGALRNVPEVREAMAVEQRATGVRGRSRLVLLVVLREPAKLDGRLVVRIRREIALSASPMHVPELVLEIPEVPTTHSGKPSERAARDALEGAPAANTEALRNPGSIDEIQRALALAVENAQELARAAEPAPEESTEARLRAIWEGVLGVSPLRPDDDFFDLGGTSLVAVRLLKALHDRLGVELSLSTLVHARTTAAMAAVIDGPADEQVQTLVLLRPGQGGRPIYIVHSVWGDVLALRPLALALDTDRPVYGVQARGLDPREQPQDRVEDMAESYVEAIRSVQPTGPYAICGYSFGGLVAFEMARVLARSGDRIEWLGLLDPNLHHTCLPPLLRWRFLAGKPFRLLRTRVATRTRLARYRREGIAPWVPLTSPRLELPPLMDRLMRSCWDAFTAYRPGPYNGSATFFSPATPAMNDDLCDSLPVWRRVVL